MSHDNWCSDCGAPLRDDFAEVINEWRKLWKDQKRDWTFALR